MTALNVQSSTIFYNIDFIVIIHSPSIQSTTDWSVIRKTV